MRQKRVESSPTNVLEQATPFCWTGIEREPALNSVYHLINWHFLTMQQWFDCATVPLILDSSKNPLECMHGCKFQRKVICRSRSQGHCLDRHPDHESKEVWSIGDSNLWGTYCRAEVCVIVMDTLLLYWMRNWIFFDQCMNASRR